jgi:hypothetical protein
MKAWKLKPQVKKDYYMERKILILPAEEKRMIFKHVRGTFLLRTDNRA